MRLLHVTRLKFAEFHGDAIPPYIATSHRWLAGTEAMINDIRKERNTESLGYQKVVGFAEYVRTHISAVEWLWIDTCCINQDSSSEISEAVNSMFKWYLNAQACLAYLFDVQNTDNFEDFQDSVWFRRGWTLQELLASRYIIFLTQSWDTIGCKGTRTSVSMPQARSLDAAISTITGVPEKVLQDYRQCQHMSTTEKLAWMSGRDTTREEDQSYCLLGIFDVTMTTQYGEGKEKARERLLRKMYKASRRRSAMETEIDAFSATRGAPAPSPHPYSETALHCNPSGHGATVFEPEKDALKDVVSRRVNDGAALDSAPRLQPVSPPPKSAISMMQPLTQARPALSGPREQIADFRDNAVESARDHHMTSADAESLQSAWSIIEEPTEQDNRYKYFLDGKGLARHILMRRLSYLAGANAEACRTTGQGRDGYVVIGSLPQEAQLEELRKQSQEHVREMRVARHLSGGG